MVKIIDNFVTKSYADSLETICQKEMDWYLEDNVSGQNKLNFDVSGANYEGPQFGFYHWALDKYGNKSQQFDKISPLVHFIEEKGGMPVNEIYRIRLALTTSVGQEVQHRPHVDFTKPHKVLLYYVNDSDGDTFMFNEKFSENFDFDKNPLLKFTLKEKIAPKKNRALIFDGLTYHNSSKPINNSTRFVINIDFN